MKAVIVIPDGLSLLLFCKGIIKTLKKSDPGMELAAVCSQGPHKAEIEALGVECIHLEMDRFVSPWKDFWYLVSLCRIFRKKRFDLVLNFSTKPNIYGTFAARFAGVDRVVSHVVGLGSSFLPARGFRDKCLQSVMLRLYRIACGLCHKVWFTNKNDLEFFLSNRVVSSNKVILTKNYLDTDYYVSSAVGPDDLSALRKELNIGEGDKVVVMVARMIWPKGIKEFAEAAVSLKAKCPYLKFLLVAPLENDSSYAVPESYIREKESVSNLRWLGFQSDVRNVYALADLAVLPTYYREGGYPRGLTEPMSMGKAVVAADNPDCAGAVEDGKNGYLVPMKNSAALADAIEDLVMDDTKRNEFGRYSRLKAERDFSEKAILEGAIHEFL